MMPRRPHLDLFNPVLPNAGHIPFTSFPQLPAEIRLLVWKHALQRHRMIHVFLSTRVEEEPDNGAKGAERYSLCNGRGRSISGNQYDVVILARYALLPENIMLVNKEARDAVLSFYPVQVPCLRKLASDKDSVLRLNLDWDYLRITTAYALPYFFDFLHDLRAYDPRGRGLQHVVMDDNCFPAPGVTSPLPASLDARALVAVKDTITNLKTVWFKSTPRGGRTLDVLTRMQVNVFNYGFPVFPTFTFFDSPVKDPRNISRDLRKVGGSASDWRERPLGWRTLLRKLGIRPEDVEEKASVDVRMMIASDREDEVRTREDAARVLHEEDFEWLQLQWWFRGWDRPR
ncbi:hypothetical protein CTA2_3931, partial [Colletotrichum tanaceti]